MRIKTILTLTAVTCCVAPAIAADAPAPADHGLYAPADIQWVAGPPSVPPGAQMAVLKGDPSKEGIFVMRLKVPAGYAIKPHWHPAFENVTVISGEANLGMGDTFDKTRGHKLPAGGFGFMAPMTHHYFWADQETVIQLHGFGPWQIYYLNPADDPRTMMKK